MRTHVALPTRCVACDDGTVKPEPFYYDWGGRRFQLCRCSRCTHQFVHPPLGPEDQAFLYSDSYFSKDGDWVCGIFGAAYVDAEAALTAEAHEILDFLPVSTGRLLDVGCAGGVFLNEARRRGFEAAGIELNQSMAAHARTAYRLDVVSARIEDVPFDQWSGAFDVVTLLDCLEHIPQPLAAMRKISRWLRPGGVVFVRGPLMNSVFVRAKEGLRRLLRISKRLPGYPLDANWFNKRSLTTLLRLSGFEPPRWIDEGVLFANLLARRRAEFLELPLAV